MPPQADVNPEPANDGENMNPQADVGGDSDGGNAADPVVNRKTPTRLIEELLKDRNQRFVGACFQTYKARPRHIKVMDAVSCGAFKAYFSADMLVLFSFREGRHSLSLSSLPTSSELPLKINMEHNHGGLEDHFPF